MSILSLFATRRQKALARHRQRTHKGAAPRPMDPHTTTRIVSDTRWLHRNQLKVGMYVRELDKPWSQTRFLFQGFRIETPEMLMQVQDACEYACIESEKLARISSNSLHRLCSATR